MAVLAIIVGQVIALPSVSLLAYAGVVFSAVATFVLCYEEARLNREFGANCEAYRRAVPRWLPGRPWRRGVH